MQEILFKLTTPFKSFLVSLILKLKSPFKSLKNAKGSFRLFSIIFESISSKTSETNILSVNTDIKYDTNIA